MASVANDIPRLTNGTGAGAGGASMESRVPAAAGVALCLLLAVAQIAWAGYQLGVGNQGIQIAFLKHWVDPRLFANDAMVRQTLPLYPTYFFRLLAPLVNVAGLEALYLMLHILTSFFTLSAVYLLGRSIFKSHTAALCAAAVLVAGHHRALAGDTLYSTGFTHTFAALPIALAAIALAYRERMVWAFVVAGVLFNVHALTAAYVVAMIGLALLADLKRLPARRWVQEVLRCGIVFGVIAAPTLLQMLAQGQVFDAGWTNLMRVRSADHSFPSSWWAAGDVDIPRFVLFFALFVLSWSFAPVRRADTARALRVTVWMTVAVGLLFAAGYVLTELWPVPLVIRLQPFRASRLLMVLMFVHIAYGAVEGIRAGAAGRALVADGSKVALSGPARVMEILAGGLVLLTLGMPTLLVLLPAAVVVVVITALVSERLSRVQAVVAVAALVVTVAAFRQIHFPLPILSHEYALWPRQWSVDPLAMVQLVAAAVIAVMVAVTQRPMVQALAITAALVLGTQASWELFEQNMQAGVSGPPPALAGVAQWAKARTEKDAIFLAPSGMGSLRIFGERGLVGDWRDGTQLYYAARFAPEWWTRLSAIEPGVLLSPDGGRLVARGRSLDTLDDEELLALAQKYAAGYILLPTPPASHPRTLAVAYTDAKYTAFLPQIAPAEAAVPVGVINPAEWKAMEKFMATTVASNIEKYRKADVTVQIVDPRGRPVQDLRTVLDETNPAFLLGCSLSFFEPNDTKAINDTKPPPVTQAELKLFPTLFNATMTPFAGKWMYIEPEDGKRSFSDLDKYMDYCTQNNIAVEYHYFTGLLPKFLLDNQKLAAERLPAHAREIVARYHDRVAFWQVMNDDWLRDATPAVFKELRATYPGIKLGLSNCVKFYSDKKDPRKRDDEMYQGFSTLPWLKKQGVQPDFFSLHGHQPSGLWADPRTMYEVIDRFAAQGVKVHISEMFLPLNTDIVGPVRKGKWTQPLQAEYFERYLTVCFSHPEVEMVNLWGMVPGWGASSGLLDGNMKPRPAFERLRKLFRETWHTKVETPLPLDGVIAARAFHGTYRLAVTLADGREVQATLNVPQKPQARFRFCLDTEAGTLTPVALPTDVAANGPPGPATLPATAPH